LITNQTDLQVHSQDRGRYADPDWHRKFVQRGLEARQM